MHTGRFKFDDTIRKWIVRLFAIVGVLTVLAMVLVVAGVLAIF